MTQKTTQGGVTVRKQKVRRDKTGVKLAVFAMLAVLVVIVAVFAPALCPYDPYAQNLSEALQPPNSDHWAGTDRYGRDLFSRIIMGSQSSIFSTLALVAIIAVVGTVIGVICGWKTGKLDVVLMRTSDVFLAFPGLVFALAIAGVLGGGMINAVIALAAISWPKYARIARGLTLAQKNEPYLAAARLAGCTTGQLVFRHILPNIAGPILVTAMLDIGTMMMELAGLSFLGLGAQPPVAEWGSMMSDNRSLLQTAPWTIIAPGIAIFIAVMVFNLLGDTIRDFMDPAHRNTAPGGQGWLRRLKQRNCSTDVSSAHQEIMSPGTDEASPTGQETASLVTSTREKKRVFVGMKNRLKEEES